MVLRGRWGGSLVIAIASSAQGMDDNGKFATTHLELRASKPSSSSSLAIKYPGMGLVPGDRTGSRLLARGPKQAEPPGGIITTPNLGTYLATR